MSIYKAVYTEVEACPNGYFMPTRIGFGRSPKKAWEAVKDHTRCIRKGDNPEGIGGTLVLTQRVLYKNGKKVYDVWD